MKEFDIDLIDKLKELIEAKDSAQVLAEIKDLHPADIAELVSELDDTDDSLFLLQLLDNETVADVLVELDEDERADLLEQMPNETIAKTLEEMDANDAVDLIQELDKDDQEDVISHIDDVEQAGDIVDLLQYDDDTAGGHMSTEMVVVNENLSMPDCIKAMREQAEDMDEIYNIYVVDDDNRLKGVFPLKKTITNPSANKIKYVMEPNPISV
ncbi:MAG: magnesium transporter, partial [Muribaculaceae bacterium]|nr:magnesium transporter [Muribaculaceae bacterium]